MKQFSSRFLGVSRMLLIPGFFLVFIARGAGEAKGTPANLTFSVGNTNGQSGTQVLVPLQASQFTSVSSFQFSLHWNPAMAAFVDVEQFGLSQLAGGNFGTTLTNGGTLTVSWDDPSGLSTTVPAGTTLFAVRLQLIGSAGSTGTVNIDGTPTTMEAANESLQTLPISVVPGQLTINQLNTRPTITTQPQSQTVVVGNSVTFSVVAAGTTPLSYQWRSNGLSLAGATLPSFMLNSVQPSYAADYTVVVTNMVGTVTSAVARLSVNLPADITSPTIVIASPTSNPTYLTFNSSINIGGTANDNVGVTQVTWSNDRGGSGVASGTANWTVTGISLQTGVNVITATVRDGAGNTAIDTLTVTYTPLSPNQLMFVVGNTNGLSSTQVLVPIQVNAFNNISSFQFSFHWDPAMAAFVDVEQFALAGLAGGNFGTTMTNSGTLTASWDDPDGLSKSVANGTPIYSVRFQLIGAAGSISSLTIDGTPTPIEAANEALQPIAVTVLPGQLTIDQVSSTPPTIITQPQDLTVIAGSNVTFNVVATGSLPLSYQWRTNGVNLVGATASTLTLNNVQPFQSGDYTVVVTNIAGVVTSLVAHLTVNLPVNTPPTISTIANQTTLEDIPTAPIAFTIGDQQTPTGNLNLTGLSSNSILVPANNILFGGSGSNRTVTLMPATNQFGTTTITIIVSDGQASASNSFILTVTPVNDPPMLPLIGNKTVNEGNLLVFEALATDIDIPAQTLTYSLDLGAPDGARIDSATGVFTWTPSEAQGPSTNTVTIRVTDNGTPSLSDFQTITIIVNEVNTAPILMPIGNKTVTEGSLLTFTALASDADLPPQTLMFSLDAGAPVGARIDPVTGIFTWTPTEAQGPSTNTVTIRVTDNGPPALSSFRTIVITVDEVNETPFFLSAIGDKTITEGSLLSFTAVATDTDIPAQTLSYRLSAGAPAGASIDPITGLFAWRPTEEQGPSSNAIAVIVTDSGVPSLSATQNIIITVLESNSPPAFLPVGDQMAQVLLLLRVTNVVTDVDVPTNHVTFELAEGPKGTRINKYSGVLSWIPARDQAPSTNVITVLAIDDGDPPLTTTNSFRVVVTDFVELSLGSAVLRAGQTGSVPVNVLTSSGVTNVSALVIAPSDRVASLGLTTLAPELRPATLEAQGPNLVKMNFNTLNGQVLQEGRLLAQLNFTAVSNHSAFVPLVLSNVTAMRATGGSVPRTLANDGRVAVVSQEPLLEALSATNSFPTLILYGEPDTNYIVEATLDLRNSNEWQTAWSGPLTNLFQLVTPATGTNYNRFFRAIRSR